MRIILSMITMSEFHSFIIFLLISPTDSYRLQCPDISQRLLRASGYCTSILRWEYTCLYDTNRLRFSEQCEKNQDYVRPGERYVITGSLRNVDCSSKQYQPFSLWSNISGVCLYQKTPCVGQGQVIFSNGSLIEDRKCRCDYTKGYTFIQRPKQNCSCNPSEEDCSCYISECPGGSVLSPDYECVEEKLQTDSECPPIQIESSDSWQRQNIKSYTDKQVQSRMRLIAVGTMFVLVVAYTVIVFVLWNKISKIECMQGISHNVENLGKMSATIVGDRNSTPTSQSSTTVVGSTTEETDQQRLNDTALEKTKLQHNDILKKEGAKIAELEQLLEQKRKEIENQKTKIDNKDKELAKRDKELNKRDIEIKKKTYDIRTFETERKTSHNHIQELKGNIRVFCRVRPLLDHDKRGNNCNINHISFPEPNKIDVVKTSNAISNEINKPKKFSFDKVFKHHATQEQVFTEISQLVQSALDGYNVCIFAYGQTGSGKTYTMEGTSVNDDDVNRGMIPRSVLQIFDTIRKLTIEGWTYSVDVSYLEIYRQEINDLLCEKKVGLKHEIQDVNDEVRVTNITTERVTTEKEVYLLLQKASKDREWAETKSNKRSSRSHSVFTLKLTGTNSITTETSKSTLTLVDLAGSERTKISGAEGQQKKETVAINQSLTSLGKFIRAIRDKDKAPAYRESKLTLLLHRSIGGNSKTLMFVNISPEEDFVEETINSLTFATEANKCKKGIAQPNK
ncbi:carboxy-terminal kinesin 2-like [Mytilus californianus]|uniref:carboxy-terminal kinesin 2-like n=1 Tax=Mytilus californianus TaxID=6549 RepID=UPI002246334E|nr:carboxy-terminal kinesin 2-like [Mytilus californianus]